MLRDRPASATTEVEDPRPRPHVGQQEIEIFFLPQRGGPIREEFFRDQIVGRRHVGNFHHPPAAARWAFCAKSTSRSIQAITASRLCSRFKSQKRKGLAPRCILASRS